MAFPFRTYLSHYKALLTLGIPIVIGQIGNVILGIADTLMIGHHSMKELAAAGFVTTIFVLIVVVALGFSLGLTPIIGSLHAKMERKRIGEYLKTSILANSLVAIVLICISLILYLNLHHLGQPEELLLLIRKYLFLNILTIPFVCWFTNIKQFYDGITHTKTPMIIILVCNVVNIIGNWILIYGHLGMPELGLQGAGIATLFSRILMVVALLLTFFLSKRYKEYLFGFIHGKIKRKDFLKLNSMGIPVAIQIGLETSAFSLSVIMVGWIGTTALAAHQVVLTISQVLYMIYIGLAAAVSVRVSHYYGKKEILNVYRAAYSGFHVIIAFAIFLCIPIFLLRADLGHWFTSDRDVCLLVSQVIIPVMAYQFGDALQYTFSNSLRGISYVKPMMWIAFLSYFIVSLPLSYFLGIFLKFGLVGIWAAYPVCLLLAGILYFVYFKKRMRLLEVNT